MRDALTDSREQCRFPGSLIFALIFVSVYVLHLPLLRLPYFWDEGGYYVPAARDLLLTGSLIPHSTLSNAHPPLVMAYLAFCWKIIGFSPPVTRSAVLLIAAFTLFRIFRLAQVEANSQVAIASTFCTALYPVFFAQSSLAHVDMAAAGLSFAGLQAYLQSRRPMMTLWFSLAALAKETAIITPIALLLWELFCGALTANGPVQAVCLRVQPRSRKWRAASLLFPLVPLGFWYAYHYLRTGYVFGNPEFFHYNVQATLHPVRVLVALAIRLWQAFGYMQLGLLTLAMLLAMWLPPQADSDGQRQKISLPAQMVFLVVIVAYVIAMAFVGGAVLARYLLPAVPLVIILSVSTLWRRVLYWRGVVLIVVLAFVVAWFVNPPYGFSMEDNLAYRDYIVLHENAEKFLESHYATARVLTAWPASDEMTRPYLGYVARPVQVLRIEDFRVEEIMSAAEERANFDVAFIFSTKYEPAHPVLENWKAWQRVKARFFGFHRDLPPTVAAQILGGHLVFLENRPGQWAAVIEAEKIEQAMNETALASPRH